MEKGIEYYDEDALSHCTTGSNPHIHTRTCTCMYTYMHAYMNVQRVERDGWMCVRDREERRKGGREGGRGE